LVKTLHGDEIDAAASALGMRRGKQIELETQDEIGVLMDYVIHNVFRDGRNAVERMLEEDPPAEGLAELRLLRSMEDAHYAVLRVESRLAGLGLNCLDGPEEIPIVLVDVGLGRTAVRGMALAARIHSPAEGWWMTTGAALPVPDTRGTNADDHPRVRGVGGVAGHHLRQAGRGPGRAGGGADGGGGGAGRAE
jgi:hypothetical protein